MLILLFICHSYGKFCLFQSILERTGYTLDVTTGQRKYGGPPPGWDGPTPGNGCEVRVFGVCR
jgi:hypothetical protein